MFAEVLVFDSKTQQRCDLKVLHRVQILRSDDTEKRDEKSLKRNQHETGRKRSIHSRTFHSQQNNSQGPGTAQGTKN
jgi:hypothetical protein